MKKKEGERLEPKEPSRHIKMPQLHLSVKQAREYQEAMVRARDPMADFERGVEAVWRSGRGPALRASMEAEVAMEKAWEAKRRKG